MAVPALTIMLFIAVGKRLAQYDVSEKRYLVVILGLWLLGICLYFARRSSRNIKLIPMSLAALALITSCGPWGAFPNGPGAPSRAALRQFWRGTTCS